MNKDYLDEFKSLDLFDDFYMLKCQKDSVLWSGFDKEPDKVLFRDYVIKNLIENPKNHLFLLRDGSTNEVMGYCQFNEEENGICEGRGSGLFKKYQGCGLASDMDILLVEKAREYGMKYMYAWCSERNIVSMRALVDAGFQKTEKTETRHMSVFNEDQTFYMWEINL